MLNIKKLIEKMSGKIRFNEKKYFCFVLISKIITTFTAQTY
jgi:hypothetical protein